MIQNLQPYRCYLYTLVLLLSVSDFVCQTGHKIDSLNNVISLSKEDTNKVNAYLGLIKVRTKTDETSLDLATKAYDLAKNLNFHVGEARATIYLSKYYHSKSDNVKAMGFISQGLIQSQKTNQAELKVTCRRRLDQLYNESDYSKDALAIYTLTIEQLITDTLKVQVISAFNNNDDGAYQMHFDYAERSLAMCEMLHYIDGKTEVYGFLTNYYLEEGNDHKKALWAASKTLEMSRKSGNKKNEAKALGIIGKVYGAENLNRECTNYYLACFKLSTQIKDTVSQLIVCLSLGNSYTNLGFDYLDSSIYYLKKARQMVSELYSGSELLEDATKEQLFAVVDQNLGMSYLNKKDTINGSKYIRSAAAVMTQEQGFFDSKDSLGKTVAYSSMAYLNTVRNNPDSTLYYLNRKINTSPIDYNFYAGDLKGIAEIYFKKGDYKKAYNYLNRSYEVHDSLLKTKIATDIQDVFIKYQTAEKEKKIIELNKDNLIGESELKASRAINTASFSAIGLILLGLFFTWYFYQNKRKTEQLVSEKKEISALLEGQEKERERIAADLHDRLGSMLATVKLYFNSVEENIEQLQKENKEYYNKANSLLDEACEEVRKISHDLASGVLVKFGLVAALNELKETVTKSNHLEMELFCFGLEKRLPTEMEVNIYRVIQEMLSNTLKHAKAKKMTVQLNRTESNLNIVIEDDGIGFDPEKMKNKDGIGLKNVRERVNKMKGNLEIDSNTKGTTMIIDIPIDKT